MKAENTKWIVYRRHRDDLTGVLRFSGSVDKAVEALQRSWACFNPKTGLSYRVITGGLIDALCESRKI